MSEEGAAHSLSRAVDKAPRYMVAGKVLTTGVFLLVLGFLLSISYGAADVGFREVWDMIFFFNSDSPAHLLIYELRMPRALSGIFVGACLAVSGSIMQGITRNPLATPSIMGLSQGSGLAIAIAMILFPAIN